MKNYQPFVDITNQFAITFNGAIYNYLELKDELEGLNVNFFTDTDTEVILNSYKIWGEECVKNLRECGLLQFGIIKIIRFFYLGIGLVKNLYIIH